MSPPAAAGKIERRRESRPDLRWPGCPLLLALAAEGLLRLTTRLAQARRSI
jgi:hypothetical protein